MTLDRHEFFPLNFNLKDASIVDFKLILMMCLTFFTYFNVRFAKTSHFNILHIFQKLYAQSHLPNLQMNEEVASWPYEFPVSKDYIKSNQRGTVRGQLLVHDR